MKFKKLKLLQSIKLDTGMFCNQEMCVYITVDECRQVCECLCPLHVMIPVQHTVFTELRLHGRCWLCGASLHCTDHLINQWLTLISLCWTETEDLIAFFLVKLSYFSEKTQWHSSVLFEAGYGLNIEIEMHTCVIMFQLFTPVCWYSFYTSWNTSTVLEICINANFQAILQ